MEIKIENAKAALKTADEGVKKVLLALLPELKETETQVHKLRPYKSAKEFLSAQAEHGPFIDISTAQLGDYYVSPVNISNYSVGFNNTTFSFSEIMKFSWQDSTLCGVLEE